jgi:hypothetical protein
MPTPKLRSFEYIGTFRSLFLEETATALSLRADRAESVCCSHCPRVAARTQFSTTSVPCLAARTESCPARTRQVGKCLLYYFGRSVERWNHRRIKRILNTGRSTVNLSFRCNPALVFGDRRNFHIQLSPLQADDCALGHHLGGKVDNF